MRKTLKSEAKIDSTSEITKNSLNCKLVGFVVSAHMVANETNRESDVKTRTSGRPSELSNCLLIRQLFSIHKYCGDLWQ